MATASLPLDSILTLPAGTVLQYEHVAFYDANNNLRLDTGDRKATITEKNGQIVFNSSEVSEQDVRSFGSRAASDFRQARKERDLLARTIPPQKTGLCLFPPEANKVGGLSIPAYPRSFRPPLSVGTVPLKEDLYSVLDLQHGENQRTVDPARCFNARNVFSRKKVAGLTLEPKEIEMSTGKYIFHPALAAFFLNNGDKVDVAYEMLNGAERVHIDLVR